MEFIGILLVIGGSLVVLSGPLSTLRYSIKAASALGLLGCGFVIAGFAVLLFSSAEEGSSVNQSRELRRLR